MSFRLGTCERYINHRPVILDRYRTSIVVTGKPENSGQDGRLKFRIHRRVEALEPRIQSISNTIADLKSTLCKYLKALPTVIDFVDCLTPKNVSPILFNNIEVNRIAYAFINLIGVQYKVIFPTNILFFHRKEIIPNRQRQTLFICYAILLREGWKDAERYDA